MLGLLVLGGLGWAAGPLLLWRVRATPRRAAGASRISVIVPARNEERNLAALLPSLGRASAALGNPSAALGRASAAPHEVLVVNDGSSDATASIAAALGAKVIEGTAPPPGWTGKTWACQQGAAAATGEALLFLDADTRFTPGGYARVAALVTSGAAVSVLPYHRVRCWYEELSLFFQIVMAMGAGGFGVGEPQLFGQSLLIERELYLRLGGHGAVRGAILEHLRLAELVRRAGARTTTWGGRGALEMRMFPDGPRQMHESWTRAFADGAAMVPAGVLVLTTLWLAGAALAAAMLLAAPWHGGTGGRGWPWLGLYLLYAGQIAWYARQVGSFRGVTSLVYPVPLIYYFGVFGKALWRRGAGSSRTWRGRQV